MIEDDSGRIYLMDFGIAKQSGGAERGLTQAGVFVGTVDYAAPEQIEAKEITTAADIYAFGGVLYEALTGQEAVRARHRRRGHVRAHHRAAAGGDRRRAPSCPRRSTR